MLTNANGNNRALLLDSTLVLVGNSFGVIVLSASLAVQLQLVCFVCAAEFTQARGEGNVRILEYPI